MSSMITGPQTDESEGPPDGLPLTLTAMDVECTFDHASEDGEVFWWVGFTQTRRVSVSHRPDPDAAQPWWVSITIDLGRTEVWVRATGLSLAEAEAALRAELEHSADLAMMAMREVAK